MPRQRKPLRAALSIGGENRFGLVGAEQVENVVRTSHLESLDLSVAFLRSKFRVTTETVPDAVGRVLDEAHQRRLEGLEVIVDPMRAEIAAHCRKALERL